MSVEPSIENLDLIELMRVPNVPIHGTLRLAKATRSSAPEQPNAALSYRLSQLDGWIERVDAALTTRMREDNSGFARIEVDFDRAVDSSWAALRDDLLRWGVYVHGGLEAMPEDMQEKAGLPAARAKHARARRVYERLFSASGLDFTRLRFFEQADAMATVLRLIDEDDLAADIEFVAGPEPLQALRVYQEFYEGMVDDRLSRERGSADNLNKLRIGLRRQLQRYAAALSTMLDDDDPSTLELVLDAMRPCITLSEELSKKRSEAEVDYDLIDPPEPGEGEGEALADEPEQA